MNKTKEFNVSNNIAVGIDQLQSMLGVGKNTADKIGKDAGAVMHVGRRKLFNVSKVQRYLDQISGEESHGE